MATGSTVNYSVPYPLSTDPVNVAGDIEQLSDFLDDFFTNPVYINDIRIDGGDINTTANTVTVFNSNATTASIFNAATNVTMGATTGTTTIRNANTVVSGDLAVNGGDLTTSQTTFNLLNANATTVNFAGAATTIVMGAISSGTTTIQSANTVVDGDLAVNGADLTTTTNTTFNLVNGNTTSINFGGSASAINIGASASQVNFAGDVNATTNYKIANTVVMNASSLGTGVVDSSLTSVGTITTGTWSATTIAVDKGGTGLTSYDVGDIVYASASTTLTKLAGVATGNALLSGGVGAAPSWGKIGLTTHVSGTLPVANGGTGVTSSTGSASVVLSDSPTLTGTPVSPTASVDTNTTQIATTAYVIGQAASASPVMDGVATIGTSLRYARQDHVHPTDTTRASVASPVFTGIVSSEGSEIIMESATTGSPTDNVSFTVERGTEPNVSIRWNETGDAWQFTNDGTTYYDIPTSAGGGGAGGFESVILLGGM